LLKFEQGTTEIRRSPDAFDLNIWEHASRQYLKDRGN
jgi:hypothetical protein